MAEVRTIEPSRVQGVLRVAIDVRVVPAVSGGVAQWVIGLAHGLSQLEPSGDEYLFIVEDGNDAWLAPYVSGPCRLLVRPRPNTSGMRPTLSRMKAWLRSRMPVLAVLWRRIRPPSFGLDSSDGFVEQLQAAVVHFPQQSAYLTTIASVYQPWDLQHIHLPEFFTAHQIAWREATYRAYCEQASLVIAASTWVKHDVAEQYAIPLDRIAVVSVPPPTDAYQPPSAAEIEAAAARLQLPSAFLFYPAQTWEHKNHVRLLEALASLRGEGLRVALVCSGHLTERHPTLIQIAEDLGIGDQIRFLGFVEPVELLTLYRKARALVFPSLYEGWGLPVVEAFRQELPVLCSDVTSLPELVGDAAITFDPYDASAIATAVRSVWNDAGVRTRLQARGVEVVSRLDWIETAAVMSALYRRVASTAGR